MGVLPRWTLEHRRRSNHKTESGAIQKEKINGRFTFLNVTRANQVQRMTILPPPPLPTAVTQLPAQFRTLIDVDARIQALAPDLAAFDASAEKRSSNESRLGEAESLENEAALLQSVHDFTKEMTQLEILMTQEIALRQSALNEAYELEHQVTPTKNKSYSNQERAFELDFDVRTRTGENSSSFRSDIQQPCIYIATSTPESSISSRLGSVYTSFHSRQLSRSR